MNAPLFDTANAVRTYAAQPPLMADDSPPQRQPKAPALIEALPVGLQSFDSVEDLAKRAKWLLDGRPFLLAASNASMAGFDTFPAVTIKAASSTPWWLACAILNHPQGRLADMAQLRAALIAAGATPADT